MADTYDFTANVNTGVDGTGEINSTSIITTDITQGTTVTANVATGGVGDTGPTGATGAAGADGTDGIDGTDGVDGKTLLNGAVDPTTEGVDGDFYINTATSTIFGPKTSGAWGTGTSIVGPTGAAGAAATITVGTVTTVDPTDPATVTNVGTSGAAIFDFEIPQGETGSVSAHDHDDRYYTETETDNLLANKENVSKVTPIAVSTATAAGTAAKVATTTGGTYTPATGDIILVTFTAANTATNPTINIDGSGAKSILLGNVNPTAVAMAGTKVMMWYDGTAFQLFGSQRVSDTDTNTTYSEISEAEITAGTASTTRTITGRRSKFIIDTAVGNVAAATQTLTNKTISGSNNTLSDIAQSSVTNLTTDLAGKVTGPASATDNALTRYNGTTGKLVQDSLITASDTGALNVNTGSATGELNIGQYAKIESRINPDTEQSNTLTSTESVDIQLGSGGYFNVYNSSGSAVFYVTGAGGAQLNGVTVVTTTGTQTLTNKTINATSNTITNVANLSVARQNDTTNSTQTGTRIETGWTFVTGDGSKSYSPVKTITFGTAFSTVPIVVTNTIGYKDGSDPSSITDFGKWENPNTAVSAQTTSTFGVNCITSDGTVIASSRRVGISWIAIGT